MSEQRTLYERQAIDEIRRKHDLTDVAKKLGCEQIRQTGGEYEGLCLFHKEKTPSMRLNNVRGKFYCFGCSSSGDLIDLVQRVTGFDFVAAMEWLGAAQLPAVDIAQRQLEERKQSEERMESIRAAVRFFHNGAPYRGSPAETYLNARAIYGIDPPAFRYGEVPSWRNRETGEWGKPRPCLMLACTDLGGVVTGIQRVYFLNGDPTLGKAAAKLSLGALKGGSIKLGPPRYQVTSCEGPEDGATIHAKSPDRSVWVAAGTGFLPWMQFPPNVRELIIAGQNDPPGIAATDKAALAHAERGMFVRKAFPPSGFKDWNDAERGIGING